MTTYNELYKLQKRMQLHLDELDFPFSIIINGRIGDCIPDKFDEDVFLLKVISDNLDSKDQKKYLQALTAAIEIVRCANEML